jgi:hypothetical protein
MVILEIICGIVRDRACHHVVKIVRKDYDLYQLIQKINFSSLKTTIKELLYSHRKNSTLNPMNIYKNKLHSAL